MRQLYSNTVSLLKKCQIERDKISSFHIIRCLGNSAEICNNLTNKNTFIQSLSYLDSYVAFKIWKKIFVTKLFWLNWAQFPQNVLFPIFLATKLFRKTLCRIMSPSTVSNSRSKYRVNISILRCTQNRNIFLVSKNKLRLLHFME